GHLAYCDYPLCVVALGSVYVDEHLFFFFQAEDGIRDFHVTGVQTCALPIYGVGARVRRLTIREPTCPSPRTPPRPRRASRASIRSEERRVGKEGRSRWAPDH